MNKGYRVGIYLRLSREDEKLGESSSITNQRAILMNYIAENGLEFVEEYVDDGVSGTTFDRVGFRKMIQDIESGTINMVLTKDTSRLGRDHIEFGYYVEKYFPEHQVRYVAVCDQIDTFYNHNDMLLFKSAYNDMYVKDISNKIRASLTIKKKNGEFVGAYAPYGYRKDSNNKHRLVLDEEAALIVKKIFDLFISGNSITKIGKILTKENIPIPSVYKGMNRGIKSSLFGVWTSRTISDILTNPTYIGNLTQGRSKKINYKSKKRIRTNVDEWIVKENSCPEIISREVFEMAQKIYQSNKNRYSNKKKQDELLLQGLVFCHECGHTIGFRRVGKKIYGNCNYYLKHRYLEGCTPHSISYLELEKLLLGEIKNTYLNDKVLKDIFSNIVAMDFEREKQNLEMECLQLKKRIDLQYQKLDHLYEDRLSGFIEKEQYSRVKDKLMLEVNEFEERIQKCISQKEILDNEDPMKLIDDLVKQYRIDRLLISILIEKITISEEGKISVFYRVGE